MVTTEYHKVAQNRQNRHEKPFFQWAKAALAKGQSPRQELEEGPRSGLYLLVLGKRRTKHILMGQSEFCYYCSPEGNV